MTEEIEPLSLDDIPEQAVAAPATKKSDDKRNVRKSDPIGRLFERTPAPSELTPIAAQAVAAADKAKADAKDKGALPELVVPETFSVATSPATSSAARSRRNLWIAIGLGAVAVIGATVVLLGHSSKPSGPAVAKASPKPAGKPADQPSTEPSHESGAPPTEPTAPTSDQPGSAAEQPTIDLPDDHVSPSMRPTATSGHASSASSATSSTSGTTSTSATVPATKPGTTGSTAAGSGAGKAGSGAGSSAKPGATVEAPVSADGCDKVSCVIDGYAKPCCEPFRPRKPGETPRELDRDMILAGMSKAKAAVIHCGEATPSAKGIVRLAMKVAPDGSVQDASVAESPDPTLGECVAAAVRKVTFAPTDQGGTFNYPFKF